MVFDRCGIGRRLEEAHREAVPEAHTSDWSTHIQSPIYELRDTVCTIAMQ